MKSPYWYCIRALTNISICSMNWKLERFLTISHIMQWDIFTIISMMISVKENWYILDQVKFGKQQNLRTIEEMEKVL